MLCCDVWDSERNDRKHELLEMITLLIEIFCWFGIGELITISVRARKLWLTIVHVKVSVPSERCPIMAPINCAAHLPSC